MIFFAHNNLEKEEEAFSYYQGKYLYKYTIRVMQDNYNVLESFSWYNMPFPLYSKYIWFFDYRAALLKIKYPKLNIRIEAGVQREGTYSSITEKHFLKNRITKAKGKVTEYKNKLDVFIKNWNSLFPYENDVLYLELKKRILEREERLKILLEEYENLKD